MFLQSELSYVARPKEGYVILGLNFQLYYEDENGQVQQGKGEFNEDLLSWAEKQIAKGNTLYEIETGSTAGYGLFIISSCTWSINCYR